MNESVIILDSDSDEDLGILGQLKAERLDSPARQSIPAKKSPTRKTVQNITDVLPFLNSVIPAEASYPILAIEPPPAVESTNKSDAVVIQKIPSCPELPEMNFELFSSDNDDDDEPLQELVQRKVSSESNAERNQSAENDDCAIVDPPIRPNSPDSGEISENVDEDISVRVDQLAESFTLTHPRHSCPKFNKFQFTEIKNHILPENEKFCPKCFCYLCEVE